MTEASMVPLRITHDGPVATLILDRPDANNSFDVVTLDAMLEAVQDLDKDPEVRAVVLTGVGKTFCTGADLSEMRRRQDDAPQLFDDLTLRYHALLAAIQRSDRVFVSAVNGVAAGGGVGLALSSDLVVMARSARLVSAYANLGVSPDGGITAHLVRTIGPYRTRAFLLLDDGIDADASLAWGLSHQVVADADAVAAARTLAQTAAARSRHTRREAKRLVALAGHNSGASMLEEERATIIEGAGDPAFPEGLLAFFEKRRPRFD